MTDDQAPAPPEAEPSPTPAAPKTPAVEPETPAPSPEPPFGAAPAKEPPGEQPLPPLEESPTPPFEDTPLPFDEDAPPKLPPSGEDPMQPLFDPTVPADRVPSTPMPEPSEGRSGPAAPGGNSAPTMPLDDPFKDDPEPGPSGGAPSGPDASSRHEGGGTEQPTLSWRTPGTGPPERLGMSHAMPIPTHDGHPRLRLEDVESTRPVSSARTRRANPLRPGRQPSAADSVVPTAGVSETATVPAERRTWRRNPLRSN